MSFFRENGWDLLNWKPVRGLPEPCPTTPLPLRPSVLKYWKGWTIPFIMGRNYSSAPGKYREACRRFIEVYEPWCEKQRNDYYWSLSPAQQQKFDYSTTGSRWRLERTRHSVKMEKDPANLPDVQSRENNLIIGLHGGRNANFADLPWSVKNSSEGRSVRDGTWGQPPDPYQ